MSTSFRIAFWVLAGVVVGSLLSVMRITAAGNVTGVDVPWWLIRDGLILHGTIGGAFGAVIGPLMIMATRNDGR